MPNNSDELIASLKRVTELLHEALRQVNSLIDSELENRETGQDNDPDEAIPASPPSN